MLVTVVVLLSSLLTLNNFAQCSGVSITDFEHVNADWFTHINYNIYEITVTQKLHSSIKKLRKPQ